MLLIILVAVLATAKIATAEIVLEPGATFDGGLCWEADGTEGIANFDGQCVTPADYDEVFSIEALAATPAINSDESIAELYGLEADGVKASDRPITFAGVNYGTFGEYVTSSHQVAL